MTYINVNLGEEVHEDQPVEEGSYTLIVNTVEEGEAKKSGAPMIKLTHQIDGHPDAALVYHNLVLPKEDDEDKAIRFKNLMLKRYLVLAGADFESDGFNMDDLQGMAFEAYLTKEQIDSDDPSAPPQFRNSIVVPRLAE